MAEQNIMNVAGDFSIDKYSPAPWICRDDNDDYWTVIRDTSGDLRVFKSTDDGVNWILKKTIINSDFLNGNPFPTNAFQIINLSGQDKVYVFICKGGAKQYIYGWIFNVTADTNQKDIDNQIVNVSATNYDSHVSWDDFSNRLLVVSGGAASNVYFGDIPALGAGTLNYKGSSADHVSLSYYISPTDGYGYLLTEQVINDYLVLRKKRNDASYHTTLSTGAISLTIANVIFGNVVTDSDGHPVIGYIYNDGGTTPKFKFEKRDKDNLAVILSSGSQDISSGTVPDSAYLTIDGNNNIYFVFTDGSDGECYYIKNDGSWGSETKVSSDNDGQLAMPEVRVPITDTNILVTYQATS